MRVITGSARGRNLAAPEGLNTRPTSDMTKGAVFSYIHPRTWWLRIIVNAWRASRRSGKSMSFYLGNAMKGVKYARQNSVFENC